MNRARPRAAAKLTTKNTKATKTHEEFEEKELSRFGDLGRKTRIGGILIQMYTNDFEVVRGLCRMPQIF
jgi:hypothetical protein